jgi:Asp-tRNA(Asn)/Glu-tRNA(Gln) amidotransferase A subunit family amidase
VLIAAPEYGSITDDVNLLETIVCTALFGLTGHPALSVPCGTGDHLVGCQFVTGWLDEATAVIR